MPNAMQGQRRSSMGFNRVILVVMLCVQIVGSVVAINQSKWIVAGALVVLAALTVMILRGIVRGGTS